MGYMVHHAIIVSGWDDKELRQTWRKAKEIFNGTLCSVSNITPPAMNNERSYFIAPDGSKRGWGDSRNGHEARQKFIAYLKEYKPYPPKWVLIQYADEEGDDRILDSYHINAETVTWSD